MGFALLFGMETALLFGAIRAIGRIDNLPFASLISRNHSACRGVEVRRESGSMKLKLTLIASTAYLALTLGAYAVTVSSDTKGVQGGTISTPGLDSEANPFSSERMASEIIIEQGSATVMTPEVPPPPPASPPTPAIR